MRVMFSAIAALGLVLIGCSDADATYEEEAITSRESSAAADSRKPDVHFVPTPQPVVEAMLELASVKDGDVLYDLGSGDGRIPITAAKTYGIRAVGIDIDPERIAEARRNARDAGVQHLVTFREGDLFETDISEASVVTLYLLDSLNLKLRPKLLAELKPGSRIVSHAFGMGDWTPERRQLVHGSNIFLWTVPEKLVSSLMLRPEFR